MPPTTRSRTPRAAWATLGLALLALGLALVALGLGAGPRVLERPAPPPHELDPAHLRGPEPRPFEAVALPADDGAVVVVHGRGWGHGVGMSQYGAHAQAQAGRGYRDILAHYYPGTEVERHAATDRSIRVGLFRNREVRDPDRLRLAPAERDGAEPEHPVTVRLGDADVTLPPGEVWTLHPANGGLALLDTEGAVQAEGAAPARVWSGSAAGAPGLWRLPQLARSGEPRSGTFRWGVLEVDVAGGLVRPTLVLPLERYLRGLAEMPSSWAPEALKAQAVAGRTYAARMLVDGPKADCACHLGATAHDQVYAGWAHEGAPGGDRWRGAVEATASEVVTYDGDLAWTFYSSSHGGRSEAAPDSWAYGAAEAEPYLVSVDDPWSLDAGVDNPRAAWAVELPAPAFARAVGLVDLDDVAVLTRTRGGSPAVLRVVGTDLAGNRVAYDFRGWRTGVAGADLKLAFRDELPGQQITAIELAEP